MQRGPKLGEAPPLEAVGPDFMTKAFELKDDDVAALLELQSNGRVCVPSSIAGKTRPQELRKLFLKEANNWYGGQVMMQMRMMQQQAQSSGRNHRALGSGPRKTPRVFPTAHRGRISLASWPASTLSSNDLPFRFEHHHRQWGSVITSE